MSDRSAIDRREFLGTSAAGAALAVTPAHRGTAAAEPPLPDRELPIREFPVPGVHIYTDATSYRAGEAVRLFTSASTPHRLEIVRHDRPTSDTSADEVIASWQVDAPKMQPVSPGSFIHVEKSIELGPWSALTVECWVRLWNVHQTQGIVTQLDDGQGLGLLAFPDGTLGFCTGDAPAAADTAHRTTAALSLPDGDASIPYVVPPANWHHVAATVGGGKKSIWIDGRRVGEWDCPDPLTMSATPLRIGAFGRSGRADGLLDADIAMPVIYARQLTDVEIKTRHAQRGLTAPNIDDAVLACWPLAEETGERIADISSYQRTGVLVNHGTWMIGGPSFLPAVARYQRDYVPADDATRGHGLRLASDDLYDCRWQPSQEFTLPEDATSGLYSARAIFDLDDEQVSTHAVFVVRPPASQQPAPVAVLFATNTYKAYSATPFGNAWSGTTNVGTRGYRPAQSDPLAAYSFYSFHRAGQPTYQLGWRMPWPAASPYATYISTDPGYAHLSRSNLWTWAWLQGSGYECDALSDGDLHFDDAALAGAKVLFIVGHNEYWSRQATRRVREFLDRGGRVIALSGNTMYWRTSYSDDGKILECRKADAWGAQLAGYMRGECWHEHDQLRGGVPRDSGDPQWATLGVEFAAAYGSMGVEGSGAFHVTDAAHHFFNTPTATDLANGDRFGFDPARPTRHPIGHESDVRVSSLMAMTRRLPALRGLATDLDDPAGIELLAEGRIDNDGTKGSYRDYAHRVLPASAREQDDSLCDVIHWRRPAGGEVFAAPSIAAGWTLGACPKWTTVMKNVLHHFGVEEKV